ncbi:AMP-dependent synthetase/ligase [Bacteroidota bacterium]
MEITRTFDILDQISEKYGQKEDMLAARIDGSWQTCSSEEFIKTVYAVSYGLLSLGLKKGDKIATISNNRPEWNFLDHGMSMVGIIQVPVYPTISEEEYEYILNHSEPKLVLVADKNLYQKISPIAAKINSIKTVYTFNEVEGAEHWSAIKKLGEESGDKFVDELKSIKADITPSDMLTILYTSGTTGMPKGVMLSHNNLISNTIASSSHIGMGPEDRALSFLPINHVYERMVNYLYQYKGISIYYAENIGSIARDAQEIHPQIFTAVPRLLESVYDKIIAKGKTLSGIKKSIFFWAVNLGNKFNPENGNGIFYKMRLSIADKLIFSKWRDVLGGCRVIITGSAAIQPRLVRIFWAAGIEVYEGYGLTETSPVICVANQVTREVKIGSAGIIIKGVEVKIAEDGEILARGPNIMMGYYKDPEMTKEVIDDEGFFHTGDIGEIVDNRWVKITDRKKEIFKLSSGKYIAPQAIENKFKESFFIEQLMVVGENQKFASAIILPNLSYLKEYCEEQGWDCTGDNDEMIKDRRVFEVVQKEVNKLNKQLGQTEQIKRYKLVKDEWTPQSGVMSPTMKLKRKVLAEKYSDLIQEIFEVDAAKE